MVAGPRRLDAGDLVGEHVVLERMRPHHVDALAAAATGDRSSYAWTVVPDGPEEAAAYVADLLALADRREAAPYVQRRTADDAVVGCTRFLNPAWPLGRADPDEVEVGGTWLSADAQRTAVNTEAKLLLLTHAFEVWEAQRVAICTDARNTRSRTAIERIGGRFEGTLRRHRAAYTDASPPELRDTAVYSVIAPEWPGVRATLRGRLAGDGGTPPGQEEEPSTSGR
jgi:RimJ/RimL family protein N-acetyltransferase